ncbi:MAG: Fic family protein [Puniceicoccales bacterium]|jgi:Fic family protein|nr:Fic family protein [Puniceicoccales bacterium]
MKYYNPQRGAQSMDGILERIEEKKEIFAGLMKNPDNRSELMKWMLTELTYTSNAIEGNTLTRRETALTLEENITSGAKPLVDYIEAKNHGEAFRFVVECAGKTEKISENLILDVHRKILQGIDNSNAGGYRSVRVRISGSRTTLPNPLKVPELMTEFVEKLSKSRESTPIKAIEAHYSLVAIHPFTDGNGRTARLLMNLILLSDGYAPLIVRVRDRKRYIDSLENKRYLPFMLRALDRSHGTAIDLIGSDVQISEKLITIGKLAKLSGVPVSTLRHWISCGKLTPIGRTQSDYMLFPKEQAAEIGKIVGQKNRSRFSQ